MEFSDMKEDKLRKKVIMPILVAMGFNDVIEYHGINEKGKDIICWKGDDFKGRFYYAIIVKKGDIHGSVGKKNSASEVLFQVRQAFTAPYRDLYGLAEVKINRCIVITSGKISSSAIESISGDIGSSNFDRLLDFIDGNKLQTLIKKYLPRSYGKIGNVVYTYDPKYSLYYFYLNPKENPNEGPRCKTETIQWNEDFMINVDFNFDGTIHGIELIESRIPGAFGEYQITPEKLIDNHIKLEQSWSEEEV